MTHHLLPGTIDKNGHISAAPVIVTLRHDGTVSAWEFLEGHEPHSTTPLRALLRLSDLTLAPL